MTATAKFLGIEIGGTKLQLVVGDGQGEITERRRHVIDAASGATGILKNIESDLVSLMSEHRVSGIGVGYGGPVDWRSGRIVRSYHVAGWDGFALAHWLRERSGLPVRVDNDANVAALAEAMMGTGRGFESIVYVTLGSGVGAGFVTRGEIFHGAVPGELELGHVRVNAQGLTVQQRCSGWAVDAIVRDAVRTFPDTELAAQWRVLREGEVKLSGGEARALAGALARGCSLAREILDDTMEHLALALSHIVHLLHPHAIIIGGGLSLLGVALMESLHRALPRFVMDAFAPGPHLALAGLGEDTVPAGALILAAMDAMRDTSFAKANG